MTKEEERSISAQFSRLLEAMQLVEIKQVAIFSRRLGDPPLAAGIVPTMEIKQAHGDGDPEVLVDSNILFRTRFDMKVLCADIPVFEHFSEFFAIFSIQNPDIYQELWQIEGIRKVFIERQLKRTLWPFLREHVLDGMVRVGLAPITLPWIL